jgi:hypothetical protein
VAECMQFGLWIAGYFAITKSHARKRRLYKLLKSVFLR